MHEASSTSLAKNLYLFLSQIQLLLCLITHTFLLSSSISYHYHHTSVIPIVLLAICFPKGCGLYVSALGFRESYRRKDKIATGETIIKSLWEALEITHHHLPCPLGQEANQSPSVAAPAALRKAESRNTNDLFPDCLVVFCCLFFFN